MSPSPTETSPEGQDSEHNTASAAATSPRSSQDESEAVASPQKSVVKESEEASEPPLPIEAPPPLPNEVPPGDQASDDGWDPVWDDKAQAFYFYNRFTKISQWDNPRIPAVTEPAPPGVGKYDRIEPPHPIDGPPQVGEKAAGGYDPAIHGDYDPDADYAKAGGESNDLAALHAPGTLDAGDAYAATGSFNRFTGKWQVATLAPENFNDENKSKRQMNAYFDVDAAANSHDGKSLKAERSGKKLTKQELKAFKDKRRERKEEKRRAWLRD